MITSQALSVKVNQMLKCSAQLSQMSPINPHPALGRPAECIMLSDSRCSRHLLAHVQTNWRTSLSSSRHELVSLSAPAPDWEPCVRDRIIRDFRENVPKQRKALGTQNIHFIPSNFSRYYQVSE